MKLSVKDRLTIMDVMPQQGSRIEMGLAEDITNKIKIDNKEAKVIGLKSSGEGIVAWDEKKAKEQEFSFTDSEIDFIGGAFTKLDKEGKFSRNMLSTDKKFR